MSPTRRRFLMATAGGCLLPRSTWAQSAKAIPHIGWISTDVQPDPFIDGFREGLRRLGYVEGTNVVLEERYSPENLEGLKAAVAELVQKKVLFIVSSGAAIRAALAVRTCPSSSPSAATRSSWASRKA